MYAELDELLEWLLTDVIADDVTSAETALRELDDKCEKLGKPCSLTMKLSYTISNVIYADTYIQWVRSSFAKTKVLPKSLRPRAKLNSKSLVLD